MNLREFIENLLISIALCVGLCSCFVGSLAHNPISYEAAIIGAVVIFQALLLIKKAYKTVIILGVLGFSIVILGSALDSQLSMFFVALALIVLAVYKYTTLYDGNSKICFWIGIVYPLFLLIGSGLFIFYTFGKTPELRRTLEICAYVSCILGSATWAVWTVLCRVLSEAPPANRGSGRTGSGSSSVTGKNTGSFATEKEIRDEVNGVAHDCIRLVDLGFGASVYFEITASVSGRDINYKVRGTMENGLTHSSYERNKVKSNLAEEKSRLRNDLMGKTKRQLSYMRLPRPMRINVSI